MTHALTWIDYSVIIVYLLGMLALGVIMSRRHATEEEYFLAGRRMPWFAVGMSIIASLLSSLTYMSEPGEVWSSGVTNMIGKMLAIPFEAVIVWVFLIPFMMRFRFTSAYEYLEHRFGRETRVLGASLFVLMVVLWMGFVVLASAQALTSVSGIPLWLVIVTVGIVATLYTMIGGLRAVIWTDVVQVILLVGGGLAAIGYVMITTGTWLPDWYEVARENLRTQKLDQSMPLFSFDPYVRATVVTVALNMCIWHICTHTGNQMTVQRYFSTSDTKAARRSFMTGTLFGVGINLMLMVVGLAMVYFYVGAGNSLDGGLDASVKQNRDLIFPTFAIHRLPPGVGGGILAALLAAAMSSIDSGINSIATVLSVEMHGRSRTPQPVTALTQQHVQQARWITLFAGVFITGAAYALNFLPDQWGIIDSMPRTFNAITGPLGGLFLIGIFLPSVGQRAALAGTTLSLINSLALGYFQQWTGMLVEWGLLDHVPRSLSFTWIMPSSVLVALVTARLFALIWPADRLQLNGLTWVTRHRPSPLVDSPSETHHA